MADDEVCVILSGRGTALVAGADAPGVPGAVVVSLGPGEELEGIPYEAWAARRGETLDLAEFRREYEALGPRAPTPPPPAAVDCPRCGCAMARGQVALEGSAWAGGARGRLRFRGAGGDGGRDEPDDVLAAGDSQAAFRCPECGSVYLP